MTDAKPLRVLSLDGNPISFDSHHLNLLGDLRTCLAEMWDVSSHDVKLVSDGGAVLREDDCTLDSMEGDITAIRISRVPWELEPFEFAACRPLVVCALAESSVEPFQHPDHEFVEWCKVEDAQGTALWGDFTSVTAIPRDVQPWQEFSSREDYVEEFDLAGCTHDLDSTRPIDVLWSFAFYNGSMYSSFGDLQQDDDVAALETKYANNGKTITLGAGKSFRMLLQLVEKRGTLAEVLIPDAFAPITQFVGKASNDEVRFACFATAKYNFFVKFVHPG